MTVTLVRLMTSVRPPKSRLAFLQLCQAQRPRSDEGSFHEQRAPRRRIGHGYLEHVALVPNLAIATSSPFATLLGAVAASAILLVGRGPRTKWRISLVLNPILGGSVRRHRRTKRSASGLLPEGLRAYDRSKLGACPSELRFHCPLGNTQNKRSFLCG